MKTVFEAMDKVLQVGTYSELVKAIAEYDKVEQVASKLPGIRHQHQAWERKDKLSSSFLKDVRAEMGGTEYLQVGKVVVEWVNGAPDWESINPGLAAKVAAAKAKATEQGIRKPGTWRVRLV